MLKENLHFIEMGDKTNTKSVSELSEYPDPTDFFLTDPQSAKQ